MSPSVRSRRAAARLYSAVSAFVSSLTDDFSNRKNSSLPKIVIGGTVLLGFVPTLSAATFNWGRGVNPPAGGFSWDNTTNGELNNWGTAPAGGFPNAIGDVANLGNNTGANNQQINLNRNITLGVISNIGSTNGTGTKTIAPGGAFSLIFNNGLSDSSISKLNTTNNNQSTISAPIVIAGNGNLNIINSSTTNLNITGSVSGTAANLAVTTGPGAVLFSGDHSGFSGTFLHSSSTSNSQFNSATSGSANASYTISAGELIFAANGNYTVQMGALSSTGGNIRGGNSATGVTTLEVGALGTNTTVAGNINNGGTKVIALNKVGGGSLTIQGTNSLGGGVTVGAGSLLVNGTLSNTGQTVAVSSGATLGGSGTIAGATSVSGILAPGNSPGILSFTGALTLNTGSTSQFEINGTATRGADFDGVNVGGSLAYGGTLSLLFNQPVTVGTYDLFGGAFSSTSGNFGMLSVGGTAVSSGSASVILGAGGWSVDIGAWSYAFDNASGDLTISAIPEPSSFAILASIGAMGYVATGRRRRVTS